jgi:hypothetical protein
MRKQVVRHVDVHRVQRPVQGLQDPLRLGLILHRSAAVGGGGLVLVR